MLITDGVSSFVMFNYDNLTWTSGTRSGGHAHDGLGGIAAQVRTTFTTFTFTFIQFNSYSYNIHDPYTGLSAMYSSAINPYSCR